MISRQFASLTPPMGRAKARNAVAAWQSRHDLTAIRCAHAARPPVWRRRPRVLLSASLMTGAAMAARP
jgi:hypothetical protein